MIDIHVPQSLCVTLPLQPEESLLSYLHRVAAANGRKLTAADIAEAAGLEGSFNVLKLHEAIDGLARKTLLTREQLSAMTYVGEDATQVAGKRTWKAFDQQLDAVLVAPNTPRVCVTCLIENPHFRQLWDVKAYTVCHKHHQHLTDKCAKCTTSISRSTRPGLACNACGEAFMAPTEVPSVCELQLAGCIAEAAGIENPAGNAFLERLPELRGLQLQPLMDLFAAILSAMSGKNVSVASMHSSPHKTADAICFLAKFFGVEWPNSLEVLIQSHAQSGALQKLLLQLDGKGLDARLIGLVATKYRSVAERFGHSIGLSKKILDSIGLMSTHQMRVSLRCGHDVLLRAASNLNVPVIPADGGMRILRIETRYLPTLATGVDNIRRSLPLPKKGKIAFIGQKHMRMTKSEVGAKLGVACITATRLAQANVFGDVRRDEAGNRRPPPVSEADVESLLKSLEAKVQPAQCDDQVSILQLSKMTPFRSRLWLGHFIMLVKKGVLVPRALASEGVGLLKLRFSRAEAACALKDVSRRAELHAFVRRHENPCRPTATSEAEVTNDAA